MGARLLAAGAALAAVVAAGVLTLAWRGDSGGESAVRAQQRGCEGAWSECAPDARWLRRVLARGGYGRVGPGTGSALLIPREGPSSLYLWAVPSVGRPDEDGSAPYDMVPRIGGTTVYNDADVRLRWNAQGRTVFLEPPPDPFLVRLLVVLTQIVPAPQRR
jgi:hypothetical protein